MAKSVSPGLFLPQAFLVLRDKYPLFEAGTGKLWPMGHPQPGFLVHRSTAIPTLPPVVCGCFCLVTAGSTRCEKGLSHMLWNGYCPALQRKRLLTPGSSPFKLYFVFIRAFPIKMSPRFVPVDWRSLCRPGLGRSEVESRLQMRI